jgi:hypothetical protein
MVSRLGHSIPQPDLPGDYAVALIWASFIGVVILMWPTSYRQRMALFALWVAKCCMTLGLMLVYESAYSLDAYGYFFDSQTPYIPYPQLQLGTGTPLMIWLAWAHSQMLPASYHAMKVTCSLIGLIAVFLGYRAWSLAFDRNDLRVLLFIGLFPSVVFWSSILGKDPIVLLGITLYLYGGAGWLRRKQLHFLVFVAAGIFIASLFRIWLAPILTGPFVLIAIRAMRSNTARLAMTGILGFTFLTLLLAAAARFGITSPERILQVVAAIASESRGWAVGGSANVISGNLGTVGGLLAFLPKGIFAALYRPLPGDVMNPFGLVSGFEGVALLWLTVRAFRRSSWGDLKKPEVQWLILLVFSWSLLYSVISYQNFGTAVRYRLQILPAFLMLLIAQARLFQSEDPAGATAEPTPEPAPVV